MSATRESVLPSDDSGGVRTLILDRPDRKNAINAQLWAKRVDGQLPRARSTENLRSEWQDA